MMTSLTYILFIYLFKCTMYKKKSNEILYEHTGKLQSELFFFFFFKGSPRDFSVLEFFLNVAKEVQRTKFFGLQ